MKFWSERKRIENRQRKGLKFQNKGGKWLSKWLRGLGRMDIEDSE